MVLEETIHATGDGTITVNAVNALERLAVLRRGGLPLSCPVPVKYVGAFPPDKEKQPRAEDVHGLRMQPLAAWLKDHKDQLTPAFVDAMTAAAK